MSKSKSIFVCSSCGAKSAKYQGRCSNCGEWETLTQEIESTSSSPQQKSIGVGKVLKLSEINTSNEKRLLTNISELDRVLGGGIIAGSLILIGGDPGIGKSTLTLQLCNSIRNIEPLYITGEESLSQIKHRAERIITDTEQINFMSETNLEVILNTLKMYAPKVAIIDSIQSIYSDKVDSTPGSINQIRECAAALMQIGKQNNIAIFLIGHITKDGNIAGPKVLEHLVDAVLQFEGEKNYSYRILRSLKNRFGSTNEIGIFDMTEEGLKEVKNPSEIFLSNYNLNQSGVAIVASQEGTRAILLEVQALVTPTSFAVPQRTSNGFDNRRLQMILAVLEKRIGNKFFKSDVFVNIAGGVTLSDTAADLAIALALVSSLNDETIQDKTVIVGEIGLTGEVRAVSAIEQRIGEAEKLGFKTIVIPKQNYEKLTKKYNIKILPADRISTILAQLLK